MSALSKELDGYLTIRRSLGFDLGTTERICACLSPLQNEKMLHTLAQLCSCDGRRRSVMRTDKHGRYAWE